jgi:hypothetical protein
MTITVERIMREMHALNRETVRIMREMYALIIDTMRIMKEAREQENLLQLCTLLALLQLLTETVS